MKNKKIVNILAQIMLPLLTISGQLATSLKYPEFGLILNMLAQPFRLYSSWQSFKKAKQIWIFITTVVFTIITAFGIINYRF